MARQAPPRVPRLLLLLALVVSATVAVAQSPTGSPGTFAPVIFVPATQSLRFGPGYTASVNPATHPPSLGVVDWKGAPVAPTYNADGSATVAGYTAYPNGTVTGPGGLSIYLQGSSSDAALFAVGATTVLRNGTIVDGSGKKVVPMKNGDGSYTAGDLTGWPNGFIIGSCGAVIYPGAPLTLTADGSVAFAPRAAVPVPGAAIALNPTTRSLSFGGYTLWLSGNELSLLDSARNLSLGGFTVGPTVGTGPTGTGHGSKFSLLDSTGQPVTTATNPDGSLSLDGYTLFKNGTITAPGGRIAINTAGPNAGLRVGRTTVLVNGTVLNGMGAKIVPMGPNEDGSYSAGDLKGWTNGTIADTKSGVVLYAGAPVALTADGRQHTSMAMLGSPQKTGGDGARDPKGIASPLVGWVNSGSTRLDPTSEVLAQAEYQGGRAG
ncbi:unnamed protein product [Closterium sp. NIES-65]|nr:unnamed protein product [Closterium sp. NIES-65]